jgi:hypothetical protein
VYEYLSLELGCAKPSGLDDDLLQILIDSSSEHVHCVACRACRVLWIRWMLVVFVEYV